MKPFDLKPFDLVMAKAGHPVVAVYQTSEGTPLPARVVCWDRVNADTDRPLAVLILAGVSEDACFMSSKGENQHLRLFMAPRKEKRWVVTWWHEYSDCTKVICSSFHETKGEARCTFDHTPPDRGAEIHEIEVTLP